MKTETLSQKQKRLSRELRKVESELGKIKLEQELPKLKAQYEGKFWKFNNTCGGNYKPWWLYSYCQEVTNFNEGIFDSFEMSPFETSFKNGTIDYFHLCQTEITKTEYMNAMKRMFKKLNKLMPL